MPLPDKCASPLKLQIEAAAALHAADRAANRRACHTFGHSSATHLLERGAIAAG